jgi:peptidoglycan/xylan/chitin deacetylase (PgdA/CDA1 family)
LRSLLRNSLFQIAATIKLDEAAIRLRRAGRKDAGPQVQVVAMHETLQRNADDFRRQVEWVAEHFELISPATFFALWERPEMSAKLSANWSKPAVLFTFDDGRESNYEVAAPLLEAMGTRGLFFVVPDFIGLSGSAAKDFYYSRIDIRGGAHSASAEEWTPMKPDQLADLAKRGHAVGNHTLSHVNLAALSQPELREQIGGAASKIASWTAAKADAFAWPYAWSAMTKQAWEAVRAGHRFCFAPCPGTTDCQTDSPYLIWRTEIESYYSEPEYRFMYSGLVNPIWSSRRRRLSGMLRA